MLSRRGLIFGAAAVAAPAIIRPGLLMPVKRMLLPDVTVFDGVMYRSISESLLRQATRSDQILGVIMGRAVEANLYCGDMVAFR